MAIDINKLNNLNIEIRKLLQQQKIRGDIADLERKRKEYNKQIRKEPSLKGLIGSRRYFAETRKKLKRGLN
jgi:hypothetical protein